MMNQFAVWHTANGERWLMCARRAQYSLALGFWVREAVL